MAATIANNDIDTAAAAVDAPWGPFTRVTDVADLPTPNSNLRLELTTALGHTVYLTYDQLLIDAVAIRKAKEAAGFTADVELFKSGVDTTDTLLTAMSAPHSYADYVNAYESIRGLLPQGRGRL